MARYRGAVCRLCRREGMKLFLKGERCFKDSCAIEKRSGAPGQHGRDRRPKKVVGYGLQLREKQKVKRMYGVLERQFKLYFERAERQRGITGENLLSFLERRLDNVVLRLGFATSHAQARQLVNHGHIQVKGRKVDVPSYLVEEGDVVSVRERSAQNEQIRYSVETVSGRGGVPDWLELDSEKLQGSVKRVPRRDDIRLPLNEQYIVELYSK
ncbi:MAG: 30S ribosomal protein S4 [Acidobacteria bacterium]|nr:30S ribosomal protein S4 [Acidobacteriota bacterium]